MKKSLPPLVNVYSYRYMSLFKSCWPACTTNEPHIGICHCSSHVCWRAPPHTTNKPFPACQCEITSVHVMFPAMHYHTPPSCLPPLVNVNSHLYISMFKSCLPACTTTHHQRAVPRFSMSTHIGTCQCSSHVC